MASVISVQPDDDPPRSNPIPVPIQTSSVGDLSWLYCCRGILENCISLVWCMNVCRPEGSCCGGTCCCCDCTSFDCNDCCDGSNCCTGCDGFGGCDGGFDCGGCDCSC